MKKIICLFLILILLTGCNFTNKIKGENKNLEKYSLVSSEDRLVFKNDNKYEVVYFENEKIVKVESAIRFETEDEAKEYYLKESYGNNNIIKCVFDVFILEQTEEYYEDYKNLKKEELITYMENANYKKM